MPALLGALVVWIMAVLPANEYVKDAAELLRDAAKKAGCASPLLSMRALGNGSLEIEIRCQEVADGR